MITILLPTVFFLTRTHPYMKANKDPLNKEIIGSKEKSLVGRKTHNLFPVFWVFWPN